MIRRDLGQVARRFRGIALLQGGDATLAMTTRGDPMTVAVAHPEPWTVEALYALPEDGMRHELLDGTLLVTPPPSVRHQLVAYRLRQLLADAAPRDGLPLVSHGRPPMEA
jgi:hypothetical protein